MSGLVDRFTPSDPYPRLLFALVACSVPVTLFLFGSVVVINALDTAEVIQGIPGLTLAALFAVVLLSSHVGHVLVRDVADRARDQREPALESAGRASVSPDGRAEEIGGRAEEIGGRAEETDRIVE